MKNNSRSNLFSGNEFQKSNQLKREFYTRGLITVAKELLGKIIVKKSDRQYLTGKIVEVEAYHGGFDEASHAFKGKTKRNEVMFKEGGHLYVYFTYGAHFCANVVIGKKNKAVAALIRGVEPIAGIETMTRNRFARKLENEKELFNLTSGPGKFAKAFGINRNHNGIDLTKEEIFILDQPKLKNSEIGVSKRIGITKSVDLPWRFYIKNNPYVSRK